MKVCAAILLLGFVISCADMTPHAITIYALDGEVLKGEYSFTSRMKGNVKVARPDSSEVLTGEFTSVDERSFSYGYSQAFGRRLEPRMVRVELQPAAQPPTLPATVGAFRIAGGFRAWDLYEDHTPSCSAFKIGRAHV